MSDQQTTTTQQPVVIRQGGNGLGSVIAASPAKNIEQGIERIKDAAGKAIESRN